MKFGLSDLSKITKISQLEETPFFFSVAVQDKVYMFGAATEENRSTWTKAIRFLAVSKFARQFLLHSCLIFYMQKNRERKADAWIATGFFQEGGSGGGVESRNRFGNVATEMPVSYI